MKKILFIASVDYHLMYFHIPHFKYFIEKGIEVHAAANMDNHRNELEEVGITCHHIDFQRNPYSISNIRAYNQIKKLLNKNTYALIHVHTPIGALVGRLAAKNSNNKSVLYTAHGFHFYKGAPLIYNLIYYNIEKLAAKITDGIITINQEDYVAAKKFKLRNNGKVYYTAGVGLEIDKYKIESKRKEILKELDIPEDSIILFSAGDIIERKNHKQIIKAISKIKNNKAYLIIAGRKFKDKELLKLAQNLGIEKRIRLLGYRKDIPQLLSACDIYVLMSKHEGLTRSVMEAMAAGKPCVVSDVRGNKDLIKNNYNGQVVPLNNIIETTRQLEKLINNKQLRKEFGENNKLEVKRYSNENILKQLDEIYGQYVNIDKQTNVPYNAIEYYSIK